MKKKYQVFVSSTYLDLKEDRQAAVEAILSAGHIPAGMELFAAGNESQLSVIKRWIDESDIYMLILGGRYGSIEPKSGKSYTQLEYEYALETGKPAFAIVMSDKLRHERVKNIGEIALELENPDKYKEFRKLVLSNMCEFYEDCRDIKFGVLKTLNDFDRRLSLSGWISGKEMQNCNKYIDEIAKINNHNRSLLKENEKLKETIEKLSEKLTLEKKSVSVDLEPIEVRIARIFKLMYYTEIDDDITYLEEGEEGKETKEYHVINVTQEFEPYYLYNDKSKEYFDIIAFITVDLGKSPFNLNRILAEVRMQIEQFPRDSSLCFEFLVISERITKEQIQLCEENFKYLLNASSVENKNGVLFEIWDTEKITKLERDFGLGFTNS